jgi:hypothetical protein
MTNSRSRSSRSKLLGALVVACAVVGWVGAAHAERKRVVVLDFEGPKSEKFHGDVVRLLKKTHTVVPTHQWNGAAEQLDAATLLDRDVRRVAKKLKVDAIIEGKIDKRRDAFLIHLKLREGKTGEVVRAGISTRADGPRIDARAQRDIKDELIGAIDEVESNRPGDDDERGRKRVAKAEAEAEDDEEEVDDRPARRGLRASKADKKRVAEAEAEEEEEEAPAPKKGKKANERGKKVAKKAEAKAEEEDEDSLPPKKAKADERAGQKVAAKSEAEAEEEDEDSLPPKKASKAEAGKRFSKRSDDQRGSERVGSAEERAALKPKTDDDAASDDDDDHEAASSEVASSEDADRVEVEAEVEPAGNLGTALARSPGMRAIELIAGASMTVRTMKFDVTDELVQRPAEYKGGRAGGAIIDATVYPLALRSRSGILKDIGVTVMYDRMLKVSSRSELTGMVVDTKATRLGAGLVFRHAFGKTAKAPVALASVTYSTQLFRIAADLDTPNVKYTMFEPGLGVRVPVTESLIVGLDAKFMAITNTGQIQRLDQYGTARVLGLEGALAVDYVFGRGLFARAAFRYETIGYKFKGNGLMSVNRDNVASTQDVTGARDNYMGGLASVGYLY